ncbi:indole-3-glycerol phosphate synthase TrpC [Sinanaerobacter sp. ZZT-01]|uniref:indole-3-glycerol phosphate synthase TrpC n=1 Tax=Sinanaerobacter sp. ZZT-01 TaxID=3111540 RepID=UPI002D7A3ABA|nr:indole-3-glycerol phosphate synthase TrpC [Sinanaerobacter sp. ZZT-01]WRR94275.1 indole-3-glycerol phosphate synthase TrpC [Sinanaerobacter sp. ZZT-01]
MILERIAEKTRKRILEQKKIQDLKTLKNLAEKMPKDDSFPFEQALRTNEISFICEVKKASPSKGILVKEFPYLTIAKEYEKVGACAISVLTEPYFFQGSNRYLEEISSSVSIPVLRKDFIVDPYQIYESKLLGASAILLICALLDTRTLKSYLETAHQLGLSALVEAHTNTEVQSAIAAGARVIGINNRDLKTFSVDLSVSLDLRKQIPDHILFVSESGIKTSEDISLLKSIGTDAVLIGETLMCSPSKQKQLSLLRGIANE